MIDILGNIVVFSFVAFLIGKVVWRESEFFRQWIWQMVKKLKDLWGWVWKYVLLLWAKKPPLKPLYIFFASIIGFALLVLFVLLYSHIILIPFDLSKLEDINTNFALAFVGTVSSFGALFGIYLAILKSETNERQTRTEEQRLIIDSISNVKEDLDKSDDMGNPIIAVRTDALYILEQNARNSTHDHIRIMEMLSGYVRSNSAVAEDMGKMDLRTPLRKDIQTALSIIGWREGIKHEMAIDYRFDLSECDLHGAELRNANLSHANFSKSCMRDVNLFNANLSGAKFNETELTLAGLYEANLTNAQFNETRLHHTNLIRANMKNAKIISTGLISTHLYGVNMSQAEIHYSNLDDSNFKSVDMRDATTYYSYARRGDFSKCKNLTQKQLDAMFFGVDVKIPANLIRNKHWPTISLNNEEFLVAKKKWFNIKIKEYGIP